jgi:hypothetical protein
MHDRGWQRHFLESVRIIGLSSYRSGIEEIDIRVHRLRGGHLDGC